jgi:hypothetical protein
MVVMIDDRLCYVTIYGEAWSLKVDYEEVCDWVEKNCELNMQIEINCPIRGDISYPLIVTAETYILDYWSADEIRKFIRERKWID